MPKLKINKAKLVIAIFILAVLIVVWSGERKTNPEPKTIPEKSKQEVLPADQATFETKSNSQGEVTVVVTPQRLGPREEENIFLVKFETHSVDLNFDFEKIMILTDDLGNQYPALRWEGGQGGHHLEGKIFSPKLKAGMQKVTLKITQIGGVERNFSWEL